MVEIIEGLNADFVANGLLQHNFLPTQKEDKEELPFIFKSTDFTIDIANSIIGGKMRKKGGFDELEYKLTRFNGVSRICSLPHPAAYADLVICIKDNWNSIKYVSENEKSVIRPRKHDDGRIIIMDYESSIQRTRRQLKSMFSRRFMVHTDISNCYPTVYSHAIPWALVGFDDAKKMKNLRNEWFNQVDEKVRMMKRNETQGIAIGPATSNIISEIILAKIDGEFGSNSDYVRFIDDYTGYFATDDDARIFIRELEDKLAKYKLLLNAKKTQIIELPQPLQDDWITNLTARLPKTNEDEKIPRNEALGYLNYAVNLAKQSPDGSVLKYALKSLLKKSIEDNAVIDVLHFTLQLCIHQPILIPLLRYLLVKLNDDDFNDFKPQLEEIARQNAFYHRSDGMVWALTFLGERKTGFSEDVVDEVIKTRDCLPLLLIYTFGNALQQTKVVDIAKIIAKTGEIYDMDQYWMLLYQLYKDVRIPNPYKDEDCFDILKASAVSFVKLDV